MTATLEVLRTRPRSRRIRVGRSGYLIAALCIVICTVMLLPLALSVLA